MCGNFGLLSLGATRPTETSSHHNDTFHKPKVAQDKLDRSVSASMHQVSKLQGIRVRDEDDDTTSEELMPVLKILEGQTACTEIRGGQAGGFSSIEYKYQKTESGSRFDSMFTAKTIAVPKMTRVRMVARKRHPLAADLADLYLKERSGPKIDPKATITVIGHTRFATSSINQVSELHPHEWVPFHEEPCWLFNSSKGRFEKIQQVVGIHISHNGDFDAMECFSSTIVNEELGLFLERVHHIPNNCRGDSPKIAGCMDLMRVAGRWGPAARMAWVRVIMSSVTDVCDGEQLSKSAPNSFPDQDYWSVWGDFFDKLWGGHINNIVKINAPSKFDPVKKYSFSVDNPSVDQFVDGAMKLLTTHEKDERVVEALNIADWSPVKLRSFVYHTVRGFLRSDLYNALTELLSRAEGSFGIQVHCTLEPGVVCIASKGQPMSIAFDPMRPIVLFASEAEALAVPVYASGKWLPERIDLDSHGEVFRLGEPRSLVEGSYTGVKKKDASSSSNHKSKHKKVKIPMEVTKKDTNCILLDCGVEIRAYSLTSCIEASLKSLIDRSVTIASAPVPYDPKVDLVANDLKVTTAVLSVIDEAWSNPESVERISGDSLAENLVKSMQRRLLDSKDTIDLLIGGVEVSLWLGEQIAADMRRIFPNLNVSTVSANKLLGVGDDNPSKVFFPGADDVLSRRIDEHTCVLLISQSGQTFGTLHATKKMVKYAPERTWILTGCFNSKMEQSIIESYKDEGKVYGRNRVFNNYSGHRPAEPSSVAVAASWHTLTHMLMHVVKTSRRMSPSGRIIHPWDMEKFAVVIQMFFIRHRKQLMRNRYHQETTVSSPKNSFKGSVPLRNIAKESDPLDVKVSGKKSVRINEDFDPLEEKMRGGKPVNVAVAVDGMAKQTSTKLTRQASSKQYKIASNTKANPEIVMNLSDGCIGDIECLMKETLIPNVSQITGYDRYGNKLIPETDKTFAASTHGKLVAQGRAWGDHINEPWHVIVAVAVYLLISVGLGLPIFGLIGDAILAIIRAGGAPIGNAGILAFTPRSPHVMYQQGIGYTLIGLALQLIDAVFFIYLGKNFTRWTRIFHGRPLAARHGKRTIVIVDTPCVHQLTEIFVSKLFSQSYSIVSVDVHGASGLDHFVHRFTHRVVRGLLIAVGRPDGRLGCLAKSEASILLSIKQAAFIRNPEYRYEGTGPEIVTIGHNPYQPNLGLAMNIVLHNGEHHTQSSTTDNESDDGLLALQRSFQPHNRRKFVDEYLYDRLFMAKKPFTTSILRSLRRAMDAEQNHKLRYTLDEALPHGVHHIDPSILLKSDSIESTVFADFIAANLEYLKPKILKDGGSVPVVKSNDPAVRLAFSSRLDSQTRQIQDLQVIVQHFYECRLASLERYIAFCVMFHAMSARCCKPWFLVPWDMARSQSNLRVATTASPISAGGGEGHEVSQEVKKLAHQMAFNLRKISTNF